MCITQNTTRLLVGHSIVDVILVFIRRWCVVAAVAICIRHVYVSYCKIRRSDADENLTLNIQKRLKSLADNTNYGCALHLTNECEQLHGQTLFALTTLKLYCDGDAGSTVPTARLGDFPKYTTTKSLAPM